MGSDNGSLPDQRQAIICTNGGILLIGTIERNFSEIWIKMQHFSYEKMNMNVPSAKWRPFCLDLNVLNGAYANLIGLILVQFWLPFKTVSKLWTNV